MTRPVALPLLLTLLLHAALAAFLLVHLDFEPEPQELKPALRIMQAKLVAMESKAVQRTAKPSPQKPQPPAPKPEPKPEPKPQPKPEPKTQPKPEPEKVAPSKADLEKQKKLEQQKKLEADKKLEEQKRKDAEAKKKEEARKAEESRKKAEAERKRQQELLQQEMAKAMAEEEQAIAAETEGQLVASYMDVIQSAVERAWSRPPSARTGMRVILAISLIPTGEVVDVAVVTSSGNDAFDRSAVAAVKRVGAFPELKEMAQKNPREFDRMFRRFNLDFYPEDLRL